MFMKKIYLVLFAGFFIVNACSQKNPESVAVEPETQDVKEQEPEKPAFTIADIIIEKDLSYDNLVP